MDIDRDIHLISCSSTLHKIAHYDGILVYLKYETFKYSFPVEKKLVESTGSSWLQHN